MTRYVFRENAVEWLSGKGFSSSEIDQLQRVLNVIAIHKDEDDPLIILPKDASGRVSTMVHLLNSITDAKGMPLCYEEKGFLGIPDDAQEFFDEEMKLAELEDAVGRLQKVKFGRTHSSPRRRSSVKDERY